MNVLVCIKRVPAPGARINITADGQEVDTSFLGFTMSPHEECAVEEAVRLVEKHGGSATVLTLGPAVAEEQLRYAASLGIKKAVLLPIEGPDWDPQRTARAIAAAISEIEARDGAFDVILFGNESADSGGFQVGVRVAYALGRPMVNGVKGIDIEGAAVTARRPIDAGFEVYELELPVVLGVKEGINLPRYPTLKGRLDSKKVAIDPFTLSEPWRQLVQGAQAAQRKLRTTVAAVDDGPLKDRLRDIAAQLDHGLEEAWAVAKRGDEIDDAVRTLDPTSLRSKLGTLEQRLAADPSPENEAAVASVRSQLESADRLKEQSAKTAATLRLTQTRLDELVARASEVRIGAADTDTYATDVDQVVLQLEALRQAVEETRTA